MRIEIFRTGTHTTMDGEALAFSAADLATTAAAYDPVAMRAPLVIGHPATDAPAWGWVRALAVEGDRLVADVEQVDAAFAEAVNTGRYGAVSASLWRPDARSNPMPGIWYLRHVGFLGAAAPAVAGLTPPRFAASGTPADFVAFACPGPLPGSLEDSVTDPNTPPAVPPTVDPPPPGTTAPPATADFAAERARIDGERAQLDAERVAFAREKAEARAADDRAFLDALVTAGRLPSGLAGPAARVLGCLNADRPVQFAADDGSQTSATPHRLARDLLAALPPAVQFGAFAGAAGPTAADRADPIAIARAADEYAAAQASKGVRVSNIEAVTAVTSGGRR